MAENKTKATSANVEDFIATVDNPQRREDAKVILQMMEEVTGLKPTMWGPSIIGFGTYHYKYDSGHEGDMCLVGFSPRKQNLSLYLSIGHEEYKDLLPKLGKHKTSKACLYINKLADIDLAVLREMMERSFAENKKLAD